jgi:hypothetical protein
MLWTRVVTIMSKDHHILASLSKIPKTHPLVSLDEFHSTPNPPIDESHNIKKIKNIS